MIIKSSYCCGKCSEEFDSEYSCQIHEKECGVLHKHICDKCGKITEYSYDDNSEIWWEKNKCWTLTPNHYRAGYGSKMDGSEFVINICDDCLHGFIHTSVHEERMMDSGSNSGSYSNYYTCDDDIE